MVNYVSKLMKMQINGSQCNTRINLSQCMTKLDTLITEYSNC